MNGNLIVVMLFILFVLGAVMPGFGLYMEQKREHELKIACINAGKNLIEGSCIGGEIE